MRTGIALCAMALAAVLTSSTFAASSNLLPAFTKDVKTKFNSSGFATITPKTKSNADILNWNLTGPSVDLVNSKYCQLPEGTTYAVDLYGTPGVGGVETSLDTTTEDWIVGHQYELDFDVALNASTVKPKEKTLTRHFHVDILGDENVSLLHAEYTLVNDGTRTLKHMEWADQSSFLDGEGNLIFTYQGGDVKVRFTAIGPDASELTPKKLKPTNLYYGPMVANASLIDIGGSTPPIDTPEPASLGILAVGASALLLKGRRGR